METHQRSNNLKFQCHLCGASYARLFALRDHFKEFHANEVSEADLESNILMLDQHSTNEAVDAQVFEVFESTNAEILEVPADGEDLEMQYTTIDGMDTASETEGAQEFIVTTVQEFANDEDAMSGAEQIVLGS